jgi:hypothetical protein
MGDHRLSAGVELQSRYGLGFLGVRQIGEPSDVQSHIGNDSYEIQCSVV